MCTLDDWLCMPFAPLTTDCVCHLHHWPLTVCATCTIDHWLCVPLAPLTTDCVCHLHPWPLTMCATCNLDLWWCVPLASLTTFGACHMHPWRCVSLAPLTAAGASNVTNLSYSRYFIVSIYSKRPKAFDRTSRMKPTPMSSPPTVLTYSFYISVSLIEISLLGRVTFTLWKTV